MPDVFISYSRKDKDFAHKLHDALAAQKRDVWVDWEDIPLASDVTPALTTVRVPMIEMGARAMTLALEPSDAELRVEHLPTEVIIRASSARRNSSA
jgi:DNA-binding LacI/PurR family transcriptional regulator